jgi:HK97 family phage major capsid protein
MTKRFALLSAAAMAAALSVAPAAAHPMDVAAAELSAHCGALFVFNDAPDRLEDLNNELLTLHQGMRNIQAAADAESRELTTEENAEIARMLARFEHVENQIETRRSIEAASARLATPNGRRTDPDDVVNAAAAATAGRKVLPQPRDADDVGKHGFKSFGEFARAVRSAQTPGGRNTDPRLIANAASPSEHASEGVPADGGYAVPPDFRRDIVIKIMGEESLLSRTDQQVSNTNNVTSPVDETNPGSASGIQAFWTAEGAQKTPTKPVLGQVTTTLNKLAAIVPVTDELLEDVGGLSNYLRTKTPQAFDFKINDAIIDGTGVGEPKGILRSGALIEVGAETNQAAGTINYQNIVNMWSRMHAQYRANAVWLINQDIEPQLMQMSFPVTGGATAVPAYMPPGGLNDAPYGRLLNRPVIPTEAAKALGTTGDIMLVDLKQYLSLTKVGGLRQDVSMHLWFDYDMTAFRFVLRMGGKPWWESPITPKNSQLTRSPYVALEDRA